MSIPLRCFGQTRVRISALSFGGIISVQVGSVFLLTARYSRPHLYFNLFMNMNTGTGTSIWRIFHTSSVVN